ncbi:MAG: aminotransferase class IV [Planctomycetota bacterium]|jgi:branched-chain amino acid aminotransferase
MKQKVYNDGKIMDLTQATISVSNPGVLHGVGLFETLRAYDAKPFRLQEHIDRMKASAEKLHIPVEEVIEQIPPAIGQVLEANQIKNARVRFTVVPPNSWDEKSRGILLVAAQQLTGYPPQLYEKGMTVYVCNQYRQSSNDPLVGHKTTSYFPRLIALREAQQRQCGEALWFTPDNLLAEGCISNIFLVKDKKLLTPPEHTPILPGITRATVLELAQNNDLSAELVPCTVEQLLDADEVFLTNSIMEIMPVTNIERSPIADEKPGPITKQLHELYKQLI